MGGKPLPSGARVRDCGGLSSTCPRVPTEVGVPGARRGACPGWRTADRWSRRGSGRSNSTSVAMAWERRCAARFGGCFGRQGLYWMMGVCFRRRRSRCVAPLPQSRGAQPRSLPQARGSGAALAARFVGLSAVAVAGRPRAMRHRCRRPHRGCGRRRCVCPSASVAPHRPVPVA